MPGIDYTLGMKTAGFDSGVKGALGQLASIGAAAAKITAGIGLAAGAGAGALIAKSIGKAADMETLRTAFVPLLGGIQHARDRMAELAAFAAATPFELPEIAAASKTLETLTRGALSTGAGLTLVGDVSSATNQSFSDVAVTIGRLYDGLQSGRPVGEVLMRLQELGAVSGQTRGQLENLQSSGKSGAQAWAIAEAALSRFSGSMKLQSGTWNGLMSTLSDTISAVMVKFGEPIMDALKPYLESAIARIDTFQAAAKAAGAAIADALGTLRAAFEGGQVFALAGATLKLGFMEAVNNLAAGIRAAVLAGVGAMEQSGLLLTFTSLFEGIGQKLASVLQSAAADFSEAIGRDGMASGFRDLSKASSVRAGNYFQIANAGAEMFDPAATAQDFVQKFKAAFASAPELINSGDASAKLDAIRRPLDAQASADSIFREIFAQQQAAAIVQPQSPSAALAASKASSANRPAADRLAQIGGYVGNRANAMANKAAENTAKFTEKTANLLAQLLSRTAATDGAVFS